MLTLPRSLCSALLLPILFAPALSAEEQKPKTPEEAKAAPSEERNDYWLDLYNGEELSEEALAADLQKVDVVYAGEIHTIQRHHDTQLFILRQMIKSGEPLALGLEQIEVTDQEAVDRFNRKELDFDGLAKAIDWEKKWRNFEQYRELCEVAQENGVEVIALNAPAKVVRQVGRKGLAGITPEERALLPKEIDTKDPAYEKLMNLMLAVHMSMDPEKLRPIFEAQVARDESMAEQTAKALKTADGQRRRVLVVCGRGHISYGLGTPDRVRRRAPEVKERIVLATESGELRLSKSEAKMRRPISISHEDLRSLNRPLGDYLHILPLRGL